MNASEPNKAADIFLKLGSLYSEDTETQFAVFEMIGNRFALMHKVKPDICI